MTYVRLRKPIFITFFVYFCLFASIAYGESQGLFPIETDEGWKYINQTGNIVVSSSWTYASPYLYDKVALVSINEGKNKRYGIIDVQGNYILEPTFTLAEYDDYDGYLYGNNHNAIIWLMDETMQCGYYDIESGYYSGCIYDDYVPWVNDSKLLLVQKNNRCGYIQRDTGGTIIPFDYSIDECLPFNHGWAVVKKIGEDEYSLINEKGETAIIPPGYEVVNYEIQNNLILIKDLKTGLFGYCNSKGDIVIQALYEEADCFNCGYTTVKKGDTIFILNENGDVTFSMEGGYSCFTDNDRIFQFHDDRMIISDLENNELLSSEELLNYQIEPYYNQEYTIVYDDSEDHEADLVNIGLIDHDGVIVLHPNKGYLYPLNHIDNRQYSRWSPFYSGYQVLIDRNNKYGYIDKQGNIAIDFLFDYAEPFQNGLARVIYNGQTEYIDETGIIVWPNNN